jgi:signal peptidase I
MIEKLKRLERENRGLLIFIVLMFCFRSAVADWNHVPTGSMIPTIIEGDRVFVNKLAYDIRVPFTLVSLRRLADPRRGDIIVFESEAADKRLIKRVVGVPGDRLSMRDNVVLLNGEALVYRQPEPNATDAPNDYLEILPSQQQYHVRLDGAGFASSFSTLIVPPGHYFVLGDSRNNSADSRYIGLVPRHEIIGQSTRVVMSLDRDNYYLPRPQRYLQPL